MGTHEQTWLTLLSLTAFGALLGETAQPGWMLSGIVAGLIVAKAHLVIAHFMEAKLADFRIRRILYAFVGIVATIVVFSPAWSTPG